MEADIVVRRATADNVHELVKMLDTVYRPKLEPGTAMIKEFPHLFSPDNAENIYYLADGQRPVSMVGVYPHEVMFQGITMQVASIGCVATLPEYQGKHLSSHILDKVIEDLTELGVALMLVSGDRGLYRRIHCVPVGRMHDIKLNTAAAEKLSTMVNTDSTYHVREVPPADRAARAKDLIAIYQAEPYRYRRTGEHMGVLVNALWAHRPGHDQRLFEVTYRKNGSEDNLVAYVVGCMSSRVPNSVEVLEWAGNRSAVLASIHPILQSFHAEQFHFHGHLQDTELLCAVDAVGADVQAATLQGTIRPLDVGALFTTLQPVFKERFGSEATFEATDDVWNVTLSGTTHTFASLEALTVWLFNHDADCLGIPFVHTDDLNYI